jgi:cellulose synthase/poly-beta-1,6-N-acetylglucosamine synthase-like glycosyltransferase
MDSFAQILAWVLAGLVLAQTALLIGYVRFLYRFRRPLLRDDECPRAAAILCVRGLDPFLTAAVKGLLQQDYPDYDVWIVVDSVRDPAWPVVNTLVQQFGRGNVRVLTLTDRLATSSRKIAGMLQALGRIDASRQIVALLDADTIPHATWLRELAAPLCDPRVGVASGNRWYMPAAPTAGSLVRYLWNAAAVVQMYCYNIGWGGSLALTAEFLRKSDLQQRLAHAFGEDSTICRCALEHGFRIAFAPSLVMVNRETCSVKGVAGFLERQLLTVRLHNPWWSAVVAHGVATTAGLGLSLLVCAAAAATAHWTAAAWLAAALAGYWASMVAMVLPLEWCARRIVRARGEPVTGFGVWGWLRVALTVPLAQAAHFQAILRALLARDHRWRGVRYQFNGVSPVQVVEDLAEAA